MTGQRTHFEYLLKKVALTQSALARLSGVSKQQINRFVTGERRPLPTVAKRMAPHLGVDWVELIEAESPKEPPSGLEYSMIVRQLDPRPGEPLNDPDELALIGLWRRLSLVKQAALFAYLGADDMPSLRNRG